jgi:NAD+ kinase
VKAAMIVAHHERPEAARLAQRAAAWFQEHHVEVWMPIQDAKAVGLDELAADRPPSGASLVVSLGGDGTMLRTVELLDGEPVPILGVNVGLLGYLSEVEPEAMTTSLERIAEGDYRIDERMLLDVSCTPGAAHAPATWRALNEAVIEKLEPGHTVRLFVSIDGAPFTTYAADGMIVATPTGSTAYSLSARGPVLSPNQRALLLTPVSPHMLFDRSLVLAPSEFVEIEVIGHRPAHLSIDGHRSSTLEPGARVVCRPSEAVARLVRFGPVRFHEILKTKFGLSDR